MNRVPGFYIDEDHPHLGGYIIGGDEATYYPDLWEWLVESYGVRSVIDVGCGEGHALAFFRDMGCSVSGIDGVPQNDRDIIEHDYTRGFPATRGIYDLCWSCEFVEHVEERYAPNFIKTFQDAAVLLMTHAVPGQEGHHHVNCQPAEYWKDMLTASGFEFDDALTAQTRELAARNRNPHNHYARSGLAFKRIQDPGTRGVRPGLGADQNPDTAR